MIPRVSPLPWERRRDPPHCFLQPRGAPWWGPAPLMDLRSPPPHRAPWFLNHCEPAMSLLPVPDPTHSSPRASSACRAICEQYPCHALASSHLPFATVTWRKDQTGVWRSQITLRRSRSWAWQTWDWNLYLSEAKIYTLSHSATQPLLAMPPKVLPSIT